jgi:transcriptional activator SPT7
MPGAGLSSASDVASNDSLDGAGEDSMMAAADDEILNEKADERPWVMMIQSKGERERVDSESGRG